MKVETADVVMIVTLWSRGKSRLSETRPSETRLSETRETRLSETRETKPSETRPSEEQVHLYNQQATDDS